MHQPLTAPTFVAKPGLATSFVFIVASVVLFWLAVVIAAGSYGAFQAPPGAVPIGMLIAISLPPGVFLLMLRRRRIKEQVLAIDPVWLAAVQGLRILGAGFLFAHAFGHLSGIFAYPAGWGDILVAVLAPFAAARLARDSRFLCSKWLWRFHVLGMLDFAGAIGSGLLSRFLYPHALESMSTAALGQFPLLLIPAFAVPVWICLHIAAFVQIGAARKAGG